MSDFGPYNVHAPKCPHCGYEDTEWWDGWRGLVANIDCPKCGAQYEAEMDTTYYFRARLLRAPDEGTQGNGDNETEEAAEARGQDHQAEG